MSGRGHGLRWLLALMMCWGRQWLILTPWRPWRAGFCCGWCWGLAGDCCGGDVGYVYCCEAPAAVTNSWLPVRPATPACVYCNVPPLNCPPEILYMFTLPFEVTGCPSYKKERTPYWIVHNVDNIKSFSACNVNYVDKWTSTRWAQTDKINTMLNCSNWCWRALACNCCCCCW